MLDIDGFWSRTWFGYIILVSIYSYSIDYGRAPPYKTLLKQLIRIIISTCNRPLFPTVLPSIHQVISLHPSLRPWNSLSISPSVRPVSWSTHLTSSKTSLGPGPTVLMVFFGIIRRYWKQSGKNSTCRKVALQIAQFFFISKYTMLSYVSRKMSKLPKNAISKVIPKSWMIRNIPGLLPVCPSPRYSGRPRTETGQIPPNLIMIRGR